MKVTVTAKSDKSVFAAVDADGNYVIISLDDIRDIELGDVLSGDFDGDGNLSKTVRNVTQGHEVRICLEDWECNRAHALEQLQRIGSPSQIFTQ